MTRSRRLTKRDLRLLNTIEQKLFDLRSKLEDRGLDSPNLSLAQMYLHEAEVGHL